MFGFPCSYVRLIAVAPYCNTLSVEPEKVNSSVYHPLLYDDIFTRVPIPTPDTLMLSILCSQSLPSQMSYFLKQNVRAKFPVKSHRFHFCAS